MKPRCPHCPVTHLQHCPALESVCEKIAVDPAARSLFIERAAAIREFAVTDDDLPATVPLAQSLASLRLGFRHCLYSTSATCACSGPHCHHLGRLVSLGDCVRCLGGQ
jgi:hypothetical protein